MPSVVRHRKRARPASRISFSDRLSRNGLSICAVSIFLLCWLAQSLFGYQVANQQNQAHGKAQQSYLQYLGTSDFWEATTENWESEFLQMSAMVVLTVFLRQKGSAQSKPEEAESDETPATSSSLAAGRFAHVSTGIYKNSLGITLFAIFLVCFGSHFAASYQKYNEQQAEHNQTKLTVIEYLAAPEFWFESMQNWQSEFLAVGSLTILSIFLRQEGSAESKKVSDSDKKTGK